jgi:hypothetical protein
MPYKSPLGRLPIKRKKNIKDPPVTLPEEILLPDGRTVPLKNIANKVTEKTSYNLRTGTAYTTEGKRRLIKRLVDTNDKE